MSLKLKRFNHDDPNYYLHNEDGQPLACPFAAGGSVTQVLYPDTRLTIGGQQPSPISDNQPRRVTCGTWCALFRLRYNKHMAQRCSNIKDEFEPVEKVLTI
jgi:hypothetical protein